ncbi:MAG: hypothetical protein ABL911_04200 [Gallionella sp.]
MKLPGQLPKTINCRDANDLLFLHLAQIGKADFLVDGDTDLLSLADTFACPNYHREKIYSSLLEMIATFITLR